MLPFLFFLSHSYDQKVLLFLLSNHLSLCLPAYFSVGRRANTICNKCEDNEKLKKRNICLSPGLTGHWRYWAECKQNWNRIKTILTSENNILNKVHLIVKLCISDSLSVSGRVCVKNWICEFTIMVEASKFWFDKACSGCACHELIHPWTYKCTDATGMMFASCIKGAYKFYAMVYLVRTFLTN